MDSFSKISNYPRLHLFLRIISYSSFIGAILFPLSYLSFAVPVGFCNLQTKANFFYLSLIASFYAIIAGSASGIILFKAKRRGATCGLASAVIGIGNFIFLAVITGGDHLL